ncbi:acyl-CoA dehydrogenase family protein [Streptomyces naganishii]|uniref:acyl-CoA dehydrogenase family protein n=1 Tax=Streptomyces naganishii TaxID=285447 RepID=UPI0036BA4D79
MSAPAVAVSGDRDAEQEAAHAARTAPGLSPRRAARTAARHAAEADRVRRLDPDVVGELTRAGCSRHFVPAEHGGTEGTFTSLVDAAAHVGEGCASAAWVGTLFAAHGRIASYLPGRARRELWDATPDTRIAAGIAPPRLDATEVPGGRRLTGEWPNVSGADFADWVLLAARAGGGGGGEAVPTLFLVPIADCAVLDTWHPAGMRGTGSSTVGVEDVFVPGHRAVPRDRLLLPREPGAARCHSVPYPFVAALMFAAPVLGAARGALADWVRTPRASTPALDAVLARSSAELRAAELLLRGAAGRADTAPVEPLTVAETVRDVVAAVELCGTAVDRLAHADGCPCPSGSTEGPVRRRLRDIRTASTHAMLRFEPSARSYAQALLGA